MRRLNTNASQESYFQKYSRLVDKESSVPKLRQLLKQLNAEVELYMLKKKPEKKKPKSLSQQKKLEITTSEQHNNEEILKRMRQELSSTNKRISVIQEQSYAVELEQKVTQLKASIKLLVKEIDQNRKLNHRLGNEIVHIEESDGMPPSLLEIKHLEKAISDQKQKNLQLTLQMQQLERANSQLSNYRGFLDEKLQKYDGCLLENQNSYAEQYAKLSAAIASSERTRKIVEDKFQIESKMIRQEIANKTVKLKHLDNKISQFELEIVQLNERLNQMQKKPNSRQERLRSVSQQMSYMSYNDNFDNCGLEQIQEQQNEQTIHCYIEDQQIQLARSREEQYDSQEGEMKSEQRKTESGGQSVKEIINSRQNKAAESEKVNSEYPQ